MKTPNNTIPPKWFTGELYQKGATVTNPLTSEAIDLNALELSLYNLIQLFHERMAPYPYGVIPTELEQMEREAVKAQQWFMTHNLRAYNILID